MHINILWEKLLGEGKVFIKNRVTFVRFGEIKPKKQRGFGIENKPVVGGSLADSPPSSYHAPPAKYGMYVFPYPHIERFLLGTRDFQPHRMEWVKDSVGNKISEKHPNWSKYEDKSVLCVKHRDGNYYLARHKKPKYIKHDGEVWHHLGEHIGESEVMARNGSWVKTNMNSYVNALRKELGRMHQSVKYKGERFSKDHLEAFIEG